MIKKKKVQEKDEGSSPQNTNQSKTKHFHYTMGTVHKGIGYLRINKGNISAKLDSAPLIIIHPI